METGTGATPDEKVYGMIGKLEELGKKLGFVANKKITLLGTIIIGVFMVILYGGWLLIKAFFKNLTKMPR
jgi:hypothetical protein